MLSWCPLDDATGWLMAPFLPWPELLAPAAAAVIFAITAIRHRLRSRPVSGAGRTSA